MNDSTTGRAPASEVLDSLVSDLSATAPSGADVVRRARRRARTRRVGGVAAASVAVLAVAAGVSVALPHGGGGGQGPAAGGDGWTWITSRGLEIEVPADWAINPLCPRGPSVVRAVGEAPMAKCAAPPEGVVYPRVVLDELLDENGRLPMTPEGGWTTWTPVPLAGGRQAWTATATAGGYVLHVTDATATTSGGEPALSATVEPAERSSRVTALTVPTLHTGITVTDADEATTRRIIASVRVIDGHDRLGCPATSPGVPDALNRPDGRASLSVPGDVRESVVCSYDASGVLQASTALDPEQSSALVDALRKAPAGVNQQPDLSAVSCVRGAENAGLQLRLKDADGATSTVWVAWQLCAARYGMSDGTGTSQVTEDVLAGALKPLHTWYSVSFKMRG